MEFILVAGELAARHFDQLSVVCDKAPRLTSVDGPLEPVQTSGLFVSGSKPLSGEEGDSYFWDGHGVGDSVAFSSGTQAVPKLRSLDSHIQSSAMGDLASDLRGIFVCLKVNRESGAFTLVLDPLYQYSVFVYEVAGTLVLSNSIYLINAVGELFTRRLTRSGLVACYEAGCSLGAGTRTGYAEVSVLPYGTMVTGRGAQWSIEKSRYRAVPNGMSYNDLLGQGANRLVNYVTALQKSAKDGALLFDLTGGQDSRLCFAAAIAAGIKDPAIFVGGDERDDDRLVARQLAQRYGGKEGNFPENFLESGLSAKDMARRAVFHQQGHSTLYHYALGTARLENVYRVRGGGGEILRSHIEPVSSGNLFADQPISLIRRALKGDSLYPRALYEYWANLGSAAGRQGVRWAFETSKKFLGQQALYTHEFRRSAVHSLVRDYKKHAVSLESMGMDLYLKDRTRRHFSYITRALNFSLGAFEPLFDSFLLAAAEALSWEERSAGRLVFDLMEALAGCEILEIPFAPKSMQTGPRAYLAERLQRPPEILTQIDRSSQVVLRKVPVPTVGSLNQWAEFNGAPTLGIHGKYLWQNRSYFYELAVDLPSTHEVWNLLVRDRFLEAVRSAEFFYGSEKKATRGMRFLHMLIWLHKDECQTGISDLAF